VAETQVISEVRQMMNPLCRTSAMDTSKGIKPILENIAEEAER